MTEYPVIAFAAFLILAYGIFSKISEKSVVSAPMVFVSVGIFISFFVGESWKEGINAKWAEPIAQITLVLVLFVDASTINLKELISEKSLPLRLLLIGLPLTMILGVLLAIPLFPGINIWALALMAFILSPTDAALGLAVVTSKIVPIRIRQTINVESGLNDGIALPPILVCIAILSGDAAGDGSGIQYWSLFTLKQFVFGPVIGGIVGLVGGMLVEQSSKRGWMNHTYQRLASVAIAILAFSLAEMVHGNGFIAAFFAGLLLGTRTPAIRERIQEFGEAESQALILFIFFLSGLLIVPFAFTYWDVNALIYALLSLTVIRMLPVAISMLGTKLGWGTIAFIGWFGPRGIASILYLLMVIIALGKEGYEVILSVITLTVLLSIFLHGITAIPFSKFFKDQSTE
jgi:NhaP-type Na+/H+ or K+/H+ antiporter